MRFILILSAMLASPPASGEETAVLKTSDGCRIEADFAAPSTGTYVFVNTHGLGSDRHEWGPFQKALLKAGYGYLSLDMRGHGGSLTCRGKKISYKNFSAADWASASLDIQAAGAWLKKKGYPRIVFCGASIGANLSLKAAAEGPLKPAAAVLLSPGLDYAGIRPDRYLEKAPGRLLIMAAENDPYAWNSSARLGLAAGKAGAAARVLDGVSGHGAGMLGNAGVTEKITGWAAGLGSGK